MMESDSDFISDVTLKNEYSDAKAQSPNDESVNVVLDVVERDFLHVRTDFLSRNPARVPQDADRFFDQMVHDSHASFYLVGPATDYDRTQKIKQIEQKVERLRLDREQMKRVGSVPRSTTPPQDEAALTWSLSDLERRIYAYQKAHNGAFPVVSDADREELLAMEAWVISTAVRQINKATRREKGGHVHFRRTLDAS